jgi:hypothetical protein
MHEIGGPDLKTRAKRWRNNVGTVTAPTYPARQLYIGDHWSIARGLAQELAPCGMSIRLWICSAGYGLISPDAAIKSYRATFTPGEQDYFGTGIITADASGAARSWWREVCSIREGVLAVGPRNLCEIGKSYPRTPMLIVLSAPYLDAVLEEVADLLRSGFCRDHLAIVSSGFRDHSGLLGDNLLPCDGRMQMAVGGALTSLNVRLARLLLRKLRGARPSVANLRELCSKIPASDAQRSKRQMISDMDVARFITGAIAREPHCSHTAALRHLREMNKACEQSRFARIFKQVSASGKGDVHA